MTAAIGVAGLVTAVLLLALQMPVAAVLAAVALLVLIMLAVVSAAPMAMLDQALAAIGADIGGLATSSGIAALPLVLILGNLAFYGGVATQLYDGAALWLRDRPGGMAMATILGCGGFGGFADSSANCVTTMGRICPPEMLQRGYNPALAGASVLVGGLQGVLILPALGLVMFALLTGVPVGAMLLAGVLPALLTLAALLLAVMLWLRAEPGCGPADLEPAPGARSHALRTLWPALLLPALLAGSLLMGLDVVAGLSLCIGLILAAGIAGHRISGAVLTRALRESVAQLVQLLLILIAARLFYIAISQSGLGLFLAGGAADAGLSSIAGMIILSAAGLVLGIFLQPLAVLALMLPLFMPLAQGLEMELIWVGIVLILLLEIAQIMPPMGVNLFILVSASRRISAEQLTEGMTRFVAPLLLVLLVLILFPALTLTLPGLIP